MHELLQSIEFWSVVVAVLALLLSAWGHWRTRRISEEQTRLQARMVELEEQRAHERQLYQKRAMLKAELIRKDSKPHIRIENRGASEARNIRGTLNGKPLKEHDCTKSLFQPINSIGANSDTRIPIRLLLQVKGQPPFDLVLHWDDDIGTDHTYSTTLR